MPEVLKQLVTIEEFEKYPEPADGSREELLRGEVTTMPTPKGRHGLIQLQIGHLLKSVVAAGKLGWVMTETGVIIDRDPDTLLGPDVVFWSIKRIPIRPDGYPELPPDLVVEVLSPDDRKKAVREKIKLYIENGVKLVWLVDPEIRTVTVYAGSLLGTELDETATLTGDDVLPEFTCTVSDFFE